MTENYPVSWKELFSKEFNKLYFKDLISFLDLEYSSQTIYPKQNEIFKAFELCAWDKIKVVIIGQDPYHGKNQANGLCFSINDGVNLPPSLKNIYLEMSKDLNIMKPKSGNLSFWAEQGILMLNSTLTVRKDEPGSHQNKGWEIFTDIVISEIASKKKHIVYILWGAFAQKKATKINENENLIIASKHPSPFSAHKGFFGSKPFSQTNTYLENIGKKSIIWSNENNLFK